MNETLVQELQETIKEIKKEIIKKQQQLDDLIEQYQKLSGIELEEDNISNE